MRAGAVDEVVPVVGYDVKQSERKKKNRLVSIKSFPEFKRIVWRAAHRG